MIRKLITAAVLLFSFVFVTTVNAQDVAALYKTKCQSCHGADGKGDTPVGVKLGARDFHAPEVAKASDAEWVKITQLGKSKMPGYQGKLTDDQIKQLVAYIRSLK